MGTNENGVDIRVRGHPYSGIENLDEFPRVQVFASSLLQVGVLVFMAEIQAWLARAAARPTFMAGVNVPAPVV
jgi:hypothetical protein